MSISLHSECRSKGMVTNTSVVLLHHTMAVQKELQASCIIIIIIIAYLLKLTLKAPCPTSRFVREHAWNNSFFVCQFRQSEE